MSKQLLFSTEAREKIFAGVIQLTNAVKSTMGPKGRNAVIEKKFGGPTVTKDGVSVAREVELEDPFENTGAQLVREAATKTNDAAGDGTTTATVLAHAIMEEGLKHVSSGVNAISMKRGIDKAVKAIVDQLEDMKKANRNVKYAMAIELCEMGLSFTAVGKILHLDKNEFSDFPFKQIENKA